MLSLVPGKIRILGGGLVEPVDEAPKWVADDPSHSDSMLPSIDTILASYQGNKSFMFFLD